MVYMVRIIIEKISSAIFSRCVELCYIYNMKIYVKGFWVQNPPRHNAELNSLRYSDDYIYTILIYCLSASAITLNLYIFLHLIRLLSCGWTRFQHCMCTLSCSAFGSLGICFGYATAKVAARSATVMLLATFDAHHTLHSTLTGASLCAVHLSMRKAHNRDLLLHATATCHIHTNAVW